MRNDLLFGICIGVGLIVALLIDKRYLEYGAFGGIAISGIIIYIKNKKNEKE